MQAAAATETTFPPVTWIMPVKNGMPFIANTLETIAAQKYPRHRLIAWDNGSTDGTQDELRRWVPSRIAGEMVLDRPLPLGRCRAELVRRSDTELIACMDADDLNRPLRLQRQVERLLVAPDIVAIGSVPDIIDDHGNFLEDWVYPLEDAEIRWRTRWQTSLNASSVMFRRSAVLAAGNYRDLNRSQDLDLWMRLARFGRMENLAERLVLYRRHTTNITAGVADYYPTDRLMAALNATDLFPGLSPHRAIELWEAAYPRYGEVRVRSHHLRMLEWAAIDAARAVHETDDYFTRTRYYGLQRFFMFRNIVRGALGLDLAKTRRLQQLRARFRRQCVI